MSSMYQMVIVYVIICECRESIVRDTVLLDLPPFLMLLVEWENLTMSVHELSVFD